MNPEEETMKHLAEQMNNLMQTTYVLDTKVATMTGNASMEVQSPMLASARSFYAITVIIKIACR